MTQEDFKLRQKHVMLDDIMHVPVDIAYTDIGSGEPLILLHGIPTWSFLYNNVMDELSKHFRVIAPDFIGHGWSDQRDFFDRSIEVQAKMILRLMDHLNIESTHLIGHDTGGGVSLILAINNGERVRKLILSNIVAYDSWPIDDMLALGNPEWSNKSLEEIKNFLLEGYDVGLTDKSQLTETFKNGIIAPYITEMGKVSLIRNASSLNTNHTTSLIDRHGTIQAETLCLWGVDDPWQTITDGERLASEIPNAKLVRLKNASHWVQQDAPERYLTEVLKFLNEN
ncbi:alpha/beta fold hydrolase [Xanthovirga aplysinae]|uniref:alpha/beta fold hydrolase n=1 Tax=Xanthovirga aplysinae TaxID=2529853 RepID=UPI001CA43B27|nr:alpha/beta hydrolase [Xanthovirga aplysinae]